MKCKDWFKVCTALTVVLALTGFSMKPGAHVDRVEMTRSEYFAKAKALTPIQKGKRAYNQQCTICHGIVTDDLRGTPYTAEEIVAAFDTVPEMMELERPKARLITNISRFLSR